MKSALIVLALGLCLHVTEVFGSSVTQVTESYTQVFNNDNKDKNVVGDWQFFPVYHLPGSAGGNVWPDRNQIHTLFLATGSLPIHFKGQSPTHRISNLLDKKLENLNTFSIELWVNDHVSEEIALLVSARHDQPTRNQGWHLSYQSKGYSYRAMSFGKGNTADSLPSSNVLEYSNTEKDGFKEYWRHIVGVYDQGEFKLFVNGKLVGSQRLESPIKVRKNSFLELSGYFGKEPYMEISNLLHKMRFHNVALTKNQIQDRFQELCDEVEKGLLFPDAFHFNANPSISGVTEKTASLVWETSESATAVVKWGTRLPLTESMKINLTSPIKKVVLSNLKPHTPYFYQVSSESAQGEKIETKLLSFRTAVKPGEPFRFAVIGDTETRPHINQQVSRMVWDERPNFVVNLGDLTDGGKEPNKFQWNYEYLLGMTPMMSRIPVFSVPGNGESDLYWYKKYHALPGEDVPYTFSFGDAQFFMLDSNKRRTEFRKGTKQYEWLENQLSKSKAKWTFVAFHHAPYTSEENDYGDSWKNVSTLGDMDVKPLIPLFEKYNVDVVMFGHLHLGERTYPIKNNKYDPTGVVYLLAGGGGGNLEDFAPNPAFFTAKTLRGHHYFMIEIIQNTMTMKLHDLNGALRDQVSTTKK